MKFYRDRIPALDGLRGVAVLLVLWSHMPSGLFGSWGDAIRYAVRPGYLGVDIFFVLSGFLITRILLDDRAKRRPLSHFMIRRFVRIFPIYYLLIAVLLIVDPGPYLGWCAAYLSNFFFAVNTAHSPMEHTWSLAVEEHFYLVWPFAVYALSVTASRRLALFGMIPAAIALAIATAFFEERLPAEADSIIYRVTFYRMMSLALGAVIAYTEPQLRRQPKRTATLMGALFLLAILIIPMTPLVDHRWVGPIMLVGFSLLSGSIVLAAIAAEQVGNVLAKVLGGSLLGFFGRISYGLYLYHLPIFTALGVWGFPKGEPPTVWISGLALLLSAGIATASFYGIEQPLLQRSAAWLKNRSARDPLEPPPIDEPTGTHRVPAS